MLHKLNGATVLQAVKTGMAGTAIGAAPGKRWAEGNRHLFPPKVPSFARTGCEAEVCQVFRMVNTPILNSPPDELNAYLLRVRSACGMIVCEGCERN